MSLNGVSKSFGGLAALNGVALEIAGGTIHGLIGPNGSGKSTLVNILSGYYRADSGSGRLDGLEILDRSMVRIARSGLLRTFQTPQLFEDLTVLENLAVAQFRDRHSSLLAALLDLPASQRAAEQARVEAVRVARALRLEGVLDRRAGDLAQGDRRILEIGRALAARPKLLVLDEPAAGLPSAEIAKLCTLLEALRDNGLTLLLIEHHLDMIMRVCDRVTVLERGQVIADGTAAEIQKDEGVRRAYLGGNRKGGSHGVA